MSDSPVTVDVQDNIPVFHFHKITRPALDHYLEISISYLNEHIALYEDRVPYCYILDVSESGMFPVKQMMDRVRNILKSMPFHPMHYIGYVTNDPRDQMLVSIIDQITARKLLHTRKIFTPEQLPEAVAWLKGIKTAHLENDLKE